MISHQAFDHTAATARILQFVHQQLLNRPDACDLQPEEDLLSSGAVDSLGVMRLVAFLEQEFSVSIAADDVTMENFLHGAAIARLVARRLEMPS